MCLDLKGDPEIFQIFTKRQKIEVNTVEPVLNVITLGITLSN